MSPSVSIHLNMYLGRLKGINVLAVVSFLGVTLGVQGFHWPFEEVLAHPGGS